MKKTIKTLLLALMLLSGCSSVERNYSFPFLHPELQRNIEIGYLILSNPDTLKNINIENYQTQYDTFTQEHDNQIDSVIKVYFKGENELIDDYYSTLTALKFHTLEYKNIESKKVYQIVFTQYWGEDTWTVTSLCLRLERVQKYNKKQ